ncbi:BON domain-containing protein [Cupriavidus necator]|uniref:BON domain-containing protein n=1 Tax=Cupriavidus necator TaxID=106590 RepID=UPI00339D2EE1
MNISRNEGGGSWWREDRDDDDVRRNRGERSRQGPGQGQQWQGQGQRQPWQGQGRGEDQRDPRGYGEGRYGQRGGSASDYGEGRYEGRQWHESDVREGGYYGSRQGAGREDWQQAGQRPPWEDEDTRRPSGGGSLRDEWGESRRGMTGRQGGMEGRGRYEQGYGISDYASPGAQTRRPQSGQSRTSSYGWESGWDEDESGRTGMYERPGSAGRRIGEPGKDAPGARESAYGTMRGRDRVGPKGYQRSDERIREEICERLAHARHVDVRDVEVEVQGGVVRLSGNVQDRRQKYSIEEIADDVFGVREIHNAVRLGSPGAFGVSGISEGMQGTQGSMGTARTSGSTTGTSQTGASSQGQVSGVSSSGSATGSSASSYGGGMETGSGGPGQGRDSTGGTTRH